MYHKKVKECCCTQFKILELKVADAYLDIQIASCKPVFKEDF